MNEEEREMELREIERMLEHFEAQTTEYANAEFASIVEHMDAAPPMAVADGAVMLLGFEGNVEATMVVPEPLPLTLRRALVRRPSFAAYDPAEAIRPDPLPVAEYERVGELTYRRVA